MADLTPEAVPAVDGVAAEFTASLADIEKVSQPSSEVRSVAVPGLLALIFSVGVVSQRKLVLVFEKLSNSVTRLYSV